jgi:hypothetical protein
VPDAPASNLDGFLWRDKYVSSTQMNRPIWNKMCISPPENPGGQAVTVSKTNSILTGKECAICYTF